MDMGRFLIETHLRTGKPIKQLATAHEVTLRYRGRLHHIGIGNAYRGWRVALLIEDRDVEIVGLDGSPLRRFVLDPTRDYQRIP